MDTLDDSVLKNVKKMLSLGEDYTPFDQDIFMHINACLAILTDLGIGPAEGLTIQDETTKWFDLPAQQLAMVKPWLYLKVRMLFDPPATSFHLEALNRQIAEFEWRLNVSREIVKFAADQAALAAARPVNNDCNFWWWW